MKTLSNSPVAVAKRKLKQREYGELLTACESSEFRMALYHVCQKHISGRVRKPLPIGADVKEWERKQNEDRRRSMGIPPRSNKEKLIQFCRDPKFRMALFHVCINRLQKLKKRPWISEDQRKAKMREASKRWQVKHREKYLAQNRERARARRRDGRDAAYSKKRLQNPVNRLVWINRARVHSAIRRQSASKLVRSIVGCDGKTLFKHIEDQFQPGMTWENQGKKSGTWQIDHVRPTASFDLRLKGEQEKAFHYTNLRPIWFDENSQKSSYWNGRKWRHMDHQKGIK